MTGINNMVRIHLVLFRTISINLPRRRQPQRQRNLRGVTTQHLQGNLRAKTLRRRNRALFSQVTTNRTLATRLHNLLQQR